MIKPLRAAQNVRDFDPQADVVALLGDPGTWTPRPEKVAHIETHGAHVFLGADQAIKIKRAVRYDYMDFSTLEKRRAMIEREYALNRPFAPDLYLGVTPITREADGRLALGGAGVPVEWALVMRRFDEPNVLSVVARNGGLTPSLVKALAETIVASHRQAERRNDVDTAIELGKAAQRVAGGLARFCELSALADVASWRGRAVGEVRRLEALLRKRRDAGFVRRCHGDLHLGNIVLIEGRPVLFDALEFDEVLATIDTLYDLAFVLMDLDAEGRRTEANLLLGHYLWRSGDLGDVEALAALPLFLSLRAAIRAMVMGQRAAVMGQRRDAAGAAYLQRYCDHACRYLSPPAPRLVAIGGLSGTGKSTLAAALAPAFGAAPGALHLRSDLERKHLAGVGETERLPASAYTAAATEDVYRRLAFRARAALAAGHSVVVDAVFQRSEERALIETVARDVRVPFEAVWLTVPDDVMEARIAARWGDASDATVEVARAQRAREVGAMTWRQMDASGDRAAVVAAVRSAVGIA